MKHTKTNSFLYQEKLTFLMNYYKVCYDNYSSHSSRVITIHGWSLTALMAYLAFVTTQQYLAHEISVYIGCGLVLAFNIIESLERRYIYIYGRQLKKIESMFMFGSEDEDNFKAEILNFEFEMDKKTPFTKIVEIFRNCIKVRQLLWSTILITILYVSYLSISVKRRH
jgi:hypothetical protein